MSSLLFLKSKHEENLKYLFSSDKVNNNFAHFVGLKQVFGKKGIEKFSLKNLYSRSLCFFFTVKNVTHVRKVKLSNFRN